jgi:hypothetical protein
MAKRKRVESDVVENKAKAVQVSKKQKSDDGPKKINQKPVAVVVKDPPRSKPEAIRIVVGSYEKILCGIDARFTSESPDTVSPNSISLLIIANPQVKSCIHVLGTHRRN